MGIFDLFNNREQRKWGYGTNPGYEVHGVTSAEAMLYQYVDDNSAVLKRSYWSKRNSGAVLLNFDQSPPQSRFLDKNNLAANLPSNVAYDVLNFLNSSGIMSGYSEGLIVIGKKGNDYSIQDYPLRGRDIGLPYLVE
jgi:hypothetical protein